MIENCARILIDCQLFCRRTHPFLVRSLEVLQIIFLSHTCPVCIHAHNVHMYTTHVHTLYIHPCSTVHTLCIQLCIHTCIWLICCTMVASWFPQLLLPPDVQMMFLFYVSSMLCSIIIMSH